MFRSILSHAQGLLLPLVLILAGATGANGADPTKLNPEVFKKWGGAEVVVTAKLTQVIGGPVGLSEPPLYTHRLQLRIDRVLRGGLKKGDMVQASHSIRQKEKPVFPEGKDCIVSLGFVRGAWNVKAIEE